MFQLSEEELREAVTLLQDLLRFDTTNPPGRERPATEYVARVLEEEGIEHQLIETGAERLNVIGRLRGTGAERPLMLSSHLDVVPAVEGQWTHPPFSGVEAGGCVWGRGAVDMKGMTAMGLTVLRLLQRRRASLKRDIILAAVADEEAGCAHGSLHLVKHHRDLIDAEYVINEVGGFTMEMRGRRFYPVQVGEKGIAWLRIRARGEPGHGSLPSPGSCLGILGKAMSQLASSRFPLHPTEAAGEFLEGLGATLGFPENLAMSLLRNPAVGGFILDHLVKDVDQKMSLQAMLCNTVNPTIVQAGSKINVVPAEAVLEVDGRTLPGQTASDLVAEVRDLIGGHFEIEIVKETEGSLHSSQTPLFDAIREVMAEHDPEGTVLPYLMPGFTDSCCYKEIGATCYGFYPLKLPPGLIFAKLFHGTDERIPVDSFRFGIETLFDLVIRFAGEGRD
uniref:Peptidase n=1 Tax=uncultured bacterium 12-5D TaxID=1497524 RepID=A0A059U2F9_9BACT|nr:peptidase [uncultured bacterium 12-5D]